MLSGYLCWNLAALSHNAATKKKKLVSKEKTSSVKSDAGQVVSGEGTQFAFRRPDLSSYPFFLLIYSLEDKMEGFQQTLNFFFFVLKQNLTT